MVDALHAAHEAVRPGGTIIDLRPDSTRPPRAERDGRAAGGFRERAGAVGDNRAGDRSVARVVKEGLLREIRSGHFWYTIEFADLARLEAWLASSRRLAGFAPGTRQRLARDPDAPVTVRRALAFGIYRRV
jgi:hypothetical protein